MEAFPIQKKNTKLFWLPSGLPFFDFVQTWIAQPVYVLDVQLWCLLLYGSQLKLSSPKGNAIVWRNAGRPVERNTTASSTGFAVVQQTSSSLTPAATHFRTGCRSAEAPVSNGRLSKSYYTHQITTKAGVSRKICHCALPFHTSSTTKSSHLNLPSPSSSLLFTTPQLLLTSHTFHTFLIPSCHYRRGPHNCQPIIFQILAHGFHFILFN